VKGGCRVGLIEGKLCCPGLGPVHPPYGDGTAGFIHNRNSHRDPLSSRVGLHGIDHFPCLFHRNRTNIRFVLAKKTGVDLKGVLMLCRQVEINKNRVHRADDLALLTIDTHLRVDIELRRSGSGMNASYRAYIDAGPIVGTKLGDNVSHGGLS